MEQWEVIIERPLEEGHRAYEKLLQTATTVLHNAASHLAAFETEWLMETLLYAPVHLLNTISQQRGDDAWAKALADGLKLLTSAVNAGACNDKHYDHIVDLCLLGYDATLRAHALGCLAAVAARSPAAAAAARHVEALLDATQCRAPLALLIGALCEHHPAAMCDDVTKIWRGYLNMLSNSKNTDTVIKAVLEGINGLFKHFGDELPTAELHHFYDNMANVYIKKAACQPACFNILRGHSSLFRERLSGDRDLRALLWDSAPVSPAAPSSPASTSAVLSAYTALAQCVDRTTLKKILTTEVLPHTQSPSVHTKLTALRVLAASKTDSFKDLSQFVDAHTLEHELRNERVSYADAETVLFCVEYNLPNSERLLQAAILFYDNLPPAFRKNIVVTGILNSPPEIRRLVIQFLISRCSDSADSQLWRDLNDADDEPAMLLVARELADCLLAALDTVPEHATEEPPKLSALLRLASGVPSHSALSCCGVLLRARSPPALAAARAALAGASDTNLYQYIRLSSCRDESALHEASLALFLAPDDAGVGTDDMLAALQIIFSSDVEPKTQVAALKKFDYLLSNEQCNGLDIHDALLSVEKLRTRGDRSDREVRILHREVTMFLGKHASVDMNNNRDDLDDAIIVDLKKSLALTLPCQGTAYKIDLRTLLLLALYHEDPSALQTLLAMLCANLLSNKEASTQRAIIRVVRALASAHASGCGDYTAAIQQAVRHCGHAACVTDMLQYISETKSCGVRKLLSTALCTLCEDTDILKLAAERSGVMLASCDSITKRAGLDIAETLIACLENNNSLSKTILPELIVLIAKTNENITETIFDVASKTFIDKKELFDEETITQTINSLLENILKNDLLDVDIYKVTVKMTVEFIKNLRDVKLDSALEAIFDICQNVIDVKVLYVLAVLKTVFGFENDISRRILGRDNKSVLNSLFDVNFNEGYQEFFEVEAVLRFIEEYCEGILELKYQELVHFLSELFTKFTPRLIKELHKSIKTCFTSLKKHWKGTPKPVLSSFQAWVEKLPIKKITDAINREYFLNEHKLCVDTLKIMSDVFDIREIILSDVKLYIQQWPSILLKLFESGRLEERFSNELPYFTDILIISLKFLTSDDVKIILRSTVDFPAKKNTGILFGGFFVHGFLEVLTEKPFILLDEDLKECSVILNDIVRLVLKKPTLKDSIDNVLELVDKLWPVFEQHATFTQKHCLLSNLECLPGPGPDSNPLQWVIRTVCSREAALNDRIRLLAFVPEEAFKSPELMSSAASLFPARLCELRPALLESVAARPAALLSVVAALAAGDVSTGWWDSALESCLVAVAKRNSLEICTSLFDRCRGERVCERVLVPLLRHSSAEVCEKFLAPLLTRILGNLNKKPRGDAAHAGHEKCWNEYMVSLHLLLLAYEKLPTWSLELPSSTLYSALGTTVSPWHLVREGCKLCHSRWDVRCPSGAGDKLRIMYRKLQCMLYNTLSAAICRRRPGAQFYNQLFSSEVLARIVDEDEKYYLPIRASWMQRTKALPVAVPVEDSTLSLSHTQRSRIFLRTLSEDPMLFDLHSPQEEIIEVQDITLSQTPLNAHGSAATLTALFRHAAGVAALAPQWTVLASALREAHRNLRWLLAQIICNCKEELKPLASVLLPGLLAVLSGTVDKSMNGLHVDVLDTILYWKEDIVSDDFNVITHHLITTCMENRRKNVFDGLLKTLQGFLELYGSSVRIEWKSFEPYYEDQHKDTQTALLKLIRMICRNKLYIPQTLSKIVAKLDANPSKMAECFGLAMAACQEVGEKQEALGVFKKYLEKCNVVTNYVRVLYYASLGSAECCGELEFRKITDYVTKVTSQDRSKCLHILSAYISRRRRCEYVADMFDTIELSEMIAKDNNALLLVQTGLPAMSEALRRRCVAQLSALNPAAPKLRRLVLDAMLVACEDIFKQPTRPPAKRQKTDTTPILSMDREDVYTNSVLTSLGLGAVDRDPDVAKAAREALGAKLDKDLGTRFAECFLLCVYLPAHSDRPLDVCVCVSALLEMLYSGARSEGSFSNCKLRDEPLPMREAAESRLLTLSKTFQGTFRNYSVARGRIRAQQDTSKPAIDVQVSFDCILENLLEFAMSSPEAARALLTEVLCSVLTGKFDLASALVPLLATLLAREPTNLTPLYIDVSRVLVKHGNVDGLLSPAGRLITLTAGTEGAALARLLYEEISIKCVGDELFRLGSPEGIEDVAMPDDALAFSIEDMKCAFGKLSNWEDLTLQQRRAVTSSLPPLWTDRKEFVASLDSYEAPANTQCWFDKMAAAYKQEMGPNSVRWLRKMDQWPRRQFEISAITEATSWRHEATEVPPSRLFETTDCLAEWAARCMIRSAYYNSLQHSATDEDKISKLSHSHELKWCMRANEMGVPSSALQCVDRNVEELCVSETLPWLRQKLVSLRLQALERRDSTLLRHVLKKAEECTPQLSSDASVSIDMYHLMLLLRRDLKSLTDHELHAILAQVNRSAQQVDWSKSSKQAVSSVYETAMAHYDEALDEGALDSDSTVSGMSAVFCRAAALGCPTADMLLAMLLRRLDQSAALSVDTARQLLEQISPLVPNLDTFTLELLEKNSSKFPSELQKSFRALLPRDSQMEKYKRCLQLVCDPYHLLLYFCEELVKAVRVGDGVLWKSTFDRMRHKIFDNPFAGPSYKLLDKHKPDLYGIQDFEPTAEFASQAESKLKPIIMAARRPPLATLRLADLCPALLGGVASAGRLLGLRARVLNMYDTVQVFTDSIRRPVVLSMLLSNGKTHRVIQKTGERLAGDAAAQRVAACALRLCCGERAGTGAYNVTLLDEESALIEYLEGHERLRTLIASTCDLEIAHSVSRPSDRSLAESPAAALQAHAQLCAKVPAHALRSAIELNSASVQEFIFKKTNFTDSLASMTILTWLLGLSDRHLQNIMCARAGRVRAVDWGDVWARAPEPPARLTRSLLALANTQVLEARLQTTLGALRGSARLLEASIRVAFHWMGPSLEDQLRHVHGILHGTTTSYLVSRDVIARDERLRSRDKYVELLDRVFEEFPDKELYSVEDQVSCLLRHCTSPEILSVTRAGWEPWV